MFAAVGACLCFFLFACARVLQMKASYAYRSAELVKQNPPPPNVLTYNTRRFPPAAINISNTMTGPRSASLHLFACILFTVSLTMILRPPPSFRLRQPRRHRCDRSMQVPAKEALEGKHVAFYFSSQAVEDQLKKAAEGQEAVRPTPVVKEVTAADQIKPFPLSHNLCLVFSFGLLLLFCTGSKFT